jgi:8-oxo-dGTP pyrophosphatase MutT (NUDIX family)
MADYSKVGLLLVRNGRILLCRKKHGTGLLILPGGCIEAGESSEECLERELREELGNVRISALEYIGTYSDRAAGDNAKTVEIQLYRGILEGTPVASSEIAELIWFSASDSLEVLAPSIRNKILPDVISRGIVGW